MTLREDPWGWARPYLARLRQHPAFAQFAPSTQFAQLLEAIATDYPAKAAEMRQWNAATQASLLQHLASRVENGAASERVTMWVAEKDDRGLCCVAKHLPHGPIDLQVYQNGEFRNSQTCNTAPEARTLSETWRKALVANGWTIYPKDSSGDTTA